MRRRFVPPTATLVLGLVLGWLAHSARRPPPPRPAPPVPAEITLDRPDGKGGLVQTRLKVLRSGSNAADLRGLAEGEWVVGLWREPEPPHAYEVFACVPAEK